MRYAIVTSALALAVTLSGTGYAAVQLSVGQRELRDRAVGATELHADAVTSSKVRDGALLARDFAPGVLLAGAPGLSGAKGPPGPTGTVVGRQGGRGEHGRPMTQMWAIVEADGTLAATSVRGAISVGRGGGPGMYLVRFPFDYFEIGSCVFTVSLGSRTAARQPGEAYAERGVDDQVVRVSTHASNPAEASDTADRPFSLLVTCP